MEKIFNEKIQEILKKAYIKYRSKAFELANPSGRFSARQAKEIVDWVIDKHIAEMIDAVIAKYEIESKQMMSIEEKMQFKNDIKSFCSKLESELQSQ